MLEFFGDPDSGLVLRAEFREELQDRLKMAGPRVSLEEMKKKLPAISTC